LARPVHIGAPGGRCRPPVAPVPGIAAAWLPARGDVPRRG